MYLHFVYFSVFNKYFKKIVTGSTTAHKYVDWVNLHDIPNVRPNSYYLRLPFYLQGSANAHILIASKENPSEFDDAYELIIGAWKDSRIVLRKRLNGAVIADVYWPNLLSELKRKKFVLEITKSGYIRLYVEDLPYKPVLEVFDPISEDWKLEVLSFKNLLRESLSFYYGNLVQDNYEKPLKELIKEKYQTSELHPWFTEYVQFKQYLDLKGRLGKNCYCFINVRLINCLIFFLFYLVLTQNSKYWEAWNSTFTHLVPVDQVYRPSGWTLRYPLYIQGLKDIRILLSATENPYNNLEQTYTICKYFNYDFEIKNMNLINRFL